MNTIALPRQTNVSENIRVSIKRLASNNGGLASFMRALGHPYKRTWERVNRNQGDLIDLVVDLAAQGIDEPLRTAVAPTPFELTPKMKFLRNTNPAKPTRSYALDIHHAVSALTSLVDRALLDNRLTSKERGAIREAAHRAKMEIARLEAKIEEGEHEHNRS